MVGDFKARSGGTALIGIPSSFMTRAGSNTHIGISCNCSRLHGYVNTKALQ
jgi:hypothetical protein